MFRSPIVHIHPPPPSGFSLSCQLLLLSELTLSFARSYITPEYTFGPAKIHVRDWVSTISGACRSVEGSPVGCTIKFIPEEIERSETPAAPTEPLRDQTRITIGQSDDFEQKYFQRQNEQKREGAEGYAWGADNVECTKRETGKRERAGRMNDVQSLQLSGTGSVFP